MNLYRQYNAYHSIDQSSEHLDTSKKHPLFFASPSYLSSQFFTRMPLPHPAVASQRPTTKTRTLAPYHNPNAFAVEPKFVAPSPTSAAASLERRWCCGSYRISRQLGLVLTAAAAAATVARLLVTEHPDEVDEDRDGERADGNRDGISAFGNAVPVAAVRPAVVVLLLFFGGKEVGRLAVVVEDGDEEVPSSNTFGVFPTAVPGGCLCEAGVASGCALKYREQDRRFTPCER